MNKFVALRHPSGKLEIVELEIGNDPIDVATSRHAYLIGITQTRERAEVLLTRETKQVALRP